LVSLGATLAALALFQVLLTADFLESPGLRRRLPLPPILFLAHAKHPSSLTITLIADRELPASALSANIPNNFLSYFQPRNGDHSLAAIFVRAAGHSPSPEQPASPA
jgi:hypothetical protein